eukprot:355369-Chlamydomonas_euryale.AAC.11
MQSGELYKEGAKTETATGACHQLLRKATASCSTHLLQAACQQERFLDRRAVPTSLAPRLQHRGIPPPGQVTSQSVTIRGAVQLQARHILVPRPGRTSCGALSPRLPRAGRPTLATPCVALPAPVGAVDVRPSDGTPHVPVDR